MFEDYTKHFYRDETRQDLKRKALATRSGSVEEVSEERTGLINKRVREDKTQRERRRVETR